MKKILFALLLLMGTAGIAQERFIEVEVTDTLVMKPVGLKYRVFVQNEIAEDSADVDMYNNKAQQEIDKQKEISLKDFLVKKGYKPITAEEDTNPYGLLLNGLGGYTVSLKSQAEADKLVAEVDKLGYAGSMKIGATYGDEAPYESQLLKKLIDKARKKAEYIAATTGMKLGRVLSIKEGSGQDVMSSMLKMASLYDKTGTKGIKSDNIIVRYEVQ